MKWIKRLVLLAIVLALVVFAFGCSEWDGVWTEEWLEYLKKKYSH